MKVSYKGDYALKAMLDLALNYETNLVTSHDLAQRIDAPVKFMEQVLLDLKKGGFIESRRGKIGGYLLSRPPKEITLGQVIRHIDGPTEPIACLSDQYSNCKDIKKCVFKKIWSQVNQAMSLIIDNIDFEQLVSEVNLCNQVFDYSI